jgi:anaerobic magnesium-protoporphyrin IX monomethyl ester cyclase
MRIVLINAPYLDIYGSLNVGHNYSFPLGLGYLAAYLKREQHEVYIYEPEIYNAGQKEIIDYLTEKKVDIVGLSCATANFYGAVRIAELVKDKLNIPVILGGVHASSLPTETLINYLCFDFVIIGEGEETMEELLRFMAAGRTDFQMIRGLCFKKDGQVICTEPRPYIENLDFLPYPARELVNLDNYRPQVHLDRGKRSATMITSRGCPGRCVFCASFKTLGYRFRAHSAEYVLGEIDHLINHYGIKHIIFVDDTFTIDRQRVIDICRGVKERNYKIDWYCFARVNTVDEELLKIMKEAGCFSLLFGIESGNQQILNNIHKGITLDQARRASAMANKLGFKVVSSFIFGNPGETKETIMQTINFAKELNPTIASFNRLIPYPGTDVYEKFYKEIYADGNANWSYFIPKGIVPLAKLDGLKEEEIQEYSNKAFLAFYLRPSQLWRLLVSVRTWGEFKAYLRGGYGLARRMIQWRAEEMKKF